MIQWCCVVFPLYFHYFPHALVVEDAIRRGMLNLRKREGKKHSKIPKLNKETIDKVATYNKLFYLSPAIGARPPNGLPPHSTEIADTNWCIAYCLI